MTGRICSPLLRMAGTGRAQARGSRHPGEQADNILVTENRICLSRRCGHCEWSQTGAIGEAQPDNREQRQGGSDEACIGVLNNFYKVSQRDRESQAAAAPGPQ